MSQARSRRRILAATVALLPLAGCASVVRQVDRSTAHVGGATTVPPTTDPATPTRSPTANPTAEPTATQSSGPGTLAQSTLDGTASSNAAAATATAGRSATPDPLGSIDPPTLAFVDVPIPRPPGGSTYATMGRSSASTVATVFGNWKCPYTRQFVVDELDGLVDSFVRPGDVALRFRDVAYHGDQPFLGADAPRAGRAGLAVWRHDPSSFWSYFATVFENQPPERDRWATVDHLRQLAGVAGVNPLDAVTRDLDDGTGEGQLRASVTAAADAGVSAVPRVVVDGTVTAPTLDLGATRDQLRRAANR